MPFHDDLRGTTASRIIALICADIADDASVRPITRGLPADAVMIERARLIIAATPLEPPLFEGSALRAATSTGCDVLLLRTGFHPEVLNPLTVTAVMTELGIPCAEPGMVFYRRRDGTLLIARPRARSAWAVTPDGLHPIEHAFADADDRSEAACRFASSITRLVRSPR